MGSAVTALPDSLELRIVSDVPGRRVAAPFSGAVEQPMSEVPLLQVLGLQKTYGGLQAVAGVDLDLPGASGGRITGLIGPNGAGKTTLLNIISGVERATAGRVLFRGNDIGALPQHRLAALGLVRTFQ